MGIARNDKRVIFPVSVSGYCHVENVNMAINLNRAYGKAGISSFHSTYISCFSL